MSRLIPIILALLLFAGQALGGVFSGVSLTGVSTLQAGETFYVNEGGDGSDPESGVAADAWDISDLATAGNWATETADDGKIGPGDTLYVMSTGGNHTGVLYVLSSGTSSRHITIEAHPTHSPVVTGGTYGYNITGQSYIDVEGIDFQSASTSGGRIASSETADASYITITDCGFNTNTNHGSIVDSPLAYPSYTAHHITFTDCPASTNGQNGFSTEGVWGTSYVAYSGCTVDGNNTSEADRQGFSAYTNHYNFTADWSSEGGTVYSRSITYEPYKIYHQQDATILTEANGDTTSVAENEWDWDSGTLYINIGETPVGQNIRVFYAATNHITYSHCTAKNTIDQTSTGYDGSGMTFDFGTEDCTAEYNEVYDNDGNGIACILSKNPHIYGNVIYDNQQGAGNDSGIKLNRATENADVHDNTVVDPGAYGIISIDGTLTATFRNNLVVNATEYGIGDDGTGTSVTESHNHLYGNGNSNDVYGITPSGDSQVGDPLFADYSGNDFDLTESSPCVDEGASATGYTEDIDGTTVTGSPDIGAYEY
jgi:parallel beta-helix repeat protein